jgi:hypothetical protein
MSNYRINELHNYSLIIKKLYLDYFSPRLISKGSTEGS